MKLKINIVHILILILLSTSSIAIDIGLSPSIANFENMLKGGYAQKKITLSTSSPENVTGHIEVKGDIAKWLSFEPTNDSFVFSKDNPLRFTIIAQPPADTANGMYSGTIGFVTDSVGTLKGTGTLVKAAVQLNANVEIIGTEIVACSAGGFRINDAELGKPIGIYASILNQGNVRLTPTITVDIWDQAQKKLLLTKNILLTEILPTLEGNFYREIEANLAQGQYWAMISIRDCKQSQLLTFSVVGEGEVSDKGRLLSIDLERFVSTGTPMQIRSAFINDGVRSVNAKFVGEVKMGKRLMSAIESDQLSVQPKETVQLTSLFTPKKSGTYTVSGRVLYNNKLTFEMSNEFVAVGEDTGNDTAKIALYAVIYIVILVLIMYLISRIRRERRRKRGAY